MVSSFNKKLFTVALLQLMLAPGLAVKAEERLPSRAQRWGNLQYLGPDTIADIAQSVSVCRRRHQLDGECWSEAAHAKPLAR
jgi:hypothetical protein